MVNEDKTSAQLERSVTPPQERSPGAHHYKRGAPMAQLEKCSSPQLERLSHITSGEETHLTLQLFRKSPAQYN